MYTVHKRVAKVWFVQVCPLCSYWTSWNVHYQFLEKTKYESGQWLHTFSKFLFHLTIVVHSNRMISQCLLNKSKAFNICKNEASFIGYRSEAKFRLFWYVSKAAAASLKLRETFVFMNNLCGYWKSSYNKQ